MTCVFESLFRQLRLKIENRRDFYDRLREDSQRRHEESHRRHEEFHRVQQEFQRRQHEFNHLHQEFHRTQHSAARRFRRRRGDIYRYHRSLKFFRPLGLVINLLILYFLFRWVGLKTISVIFAFLIIALESAQFIFLWRLERRFFKPILELKNGVEEIARGNYAVKVETGGLHMGFVGSLVASFNEMAQKLQVGEKLKSEYEENRKNLIANISHDLKTPITSVQGYIEAIQDGVVNSPEKVEKYLQTIHQNVVYMDKLIDDLFVFSKLDLQKLEFKFETVRVQAFMRDLMEEFKFELEERQIDFSYRDEIEDDCWLKIDRKRLHQVFQNIIGNAVKYGANPDFKIDVRVGRQEDVLVIEIADNGPGIPGDKLPYIFNRFYRIDNQRTKDLMSTGLGLAIAKELVQAHGGSIEVASVEREGTCFFLKFPVINPENEVSYETDFNH